MGGIPAAQKTCRNAMLWLVLLLLFSVTLSRSSYSDTMWVDSRWHSSYLIGVCFLPPSKWYFEILFWCWRLWGMNMGIWGWVGFRNRILVLLFLLWFLSNLPQCLPHQQRNIPIPRLWLTSLRFFPYIYVFKFCNNTTFSFFSADFCSSGEIFISFYSFAMHEVPFFILIESLCNLPCCICNLPFTSCDFLYIDNSLLGPLGIHVSPNNSLFLVISHFTHPLLLWSFRRLFLSLSASILIGPKLFSYIYSNKEGNI